MSASDVHQTWGKTMENALKCWEGVLTQISTSNANVLHNQVKLSSKTGQPLSVYWKHTLQLINFTIIFTKKNKKKTNRKRKRLNRHFQAGQALAYNPSYAGGRDQEDRGSKPAPGK
jgi:hypothetical protein